MKSADTTYVVANLLYLQKRKYNNKYSKYGNDFSRFAFLVSRETNTFLRGGCLLSSSRTTYHSVLLYHPMTSRDSHGRSLRIKLLLPSSAVVGISLGLLKPAFVRRDRGVYTHEKTKTLYYFTCIHTYIHNAKRTIISVCLFECAR